MAYVVCATHAASDHVRRLVLEDAVPRLESRRRELFETVE